MRLNVTVGVALYCSFPQLLTSAYARERTYSGKTKAGGISQCICAVSLECDGSFLTESRREFLIIKNDETFTYIYLYLIIFSSMNSQMREIMFYFDDVLKKVLSRISFFYYYY